MIKQKHYMSDAKLLMIAWCSSEITPQSVYEHIGYIRKYSQYTIDIYNVADSTLQSHQLNEFSEKTGVIKLSQYAGVIIHNTIAYDPDNVRRVEKLFDIPIQSYSGLKVLMKQDEIYKTYSNQKLIKEWKFNLLLTCVPHRDIDIIYPPADFGKIKKLFTLTCYVTEEMKNYQTPTYESRPIDICYRGMKLPYYFGKLSYMKFEIGEKFKIFCQQYGVNYDISSEIKDRIYGDAWIRFLANSKACLAVESGASIYDFDGKVSKKTQKYLKKKPDASFEEVYNKILKPFDSRYIYNAVSPRHFEAAATKTVLIMIEGEYGGIFKPDRHYIPVKPDYSNSSEIFAKMKDRDYCSDLIDNAFADIIMNPMYSYKTFVEKFDQEISLFFKQ